MIPDTSVLTPVLFVFRHCTISPVRQPLSHPSPNYLPTPGSWSTCALSKIPPRDMEFNRSMFKTEGIKLSSRLSEMVCRDMSPPRGVFHGQEHNTHEGDGPSPVSYFLAHKTYVQCQLPSPKQPCWKKVKQCSKMNSPVSRAALEVQKSRHPLQPPTNLHTLGWKAIPQRPPKPPCRDRCKRWLGGEARLFRVFLNFFKS